MNDGLLAGEDYGSSMKAQRVQVKVGQGSSVYRGEAIVWGTADDITAGGQRSQGGALTTPKQDFVLKVPITKINNLPVSSTAIMFTTPDGGIAGGNKRGLGAIDLQYYRTTATQVASGDSAILIGQVNTASGANSTVIGYNNTISNSRSTGIGTSNSSNGTNSTVIGYNNTANSASSIAIGDTCSASGNQSVSIGSSSSTASATQTISIGYANTASSPNATSLGSNCISNGSSSTSIGDGARVFGVFGKFCYSASFLSSAGDNQKGTYQFKRRTTDATATVLTTNNAAAAATNQMILSNYSVFGFHGTITARQQGAGGAVAKVWEVKGAIRREANAASTTLVGTPIVTELGADAGASTWTLTLSADTTNGGLAVTGTGAAATNIQWSGYIDCAESIYA